MYAMMLQTRNARMTFTTAKHQFQKVYKLQKIHYLKWLSIATVQQSWKSLFATHSFHHVILTAHFGHPYPANHSVIQSTRNAGSSSLMLAYYCLTVIIFIPKPPVTIIVQQAFVKLKSGLLHGLRNSGHHHPVSMAVYLQLDRFQTDIFNITVAFMFDLNVRFTMHVFGLVLLSYTGVPLYNYKPNRFIAYSCSPA